MDDNWAALAVSILREVTPEQAWVLLDSPDAKRPYGRNPAIDADTRACRAQGMTYDQIAEQYGIDRTAVYRRVNKGRPTTVGQGA